ncbi:DEAD/DEAH box helicase [Micromonospora carbonacea]|uniref:Helicase conserved C-terminal domain-containing protein n=1 Tax=Micromonospora carbonacea TaxID=47853 RepID=A0A1C4V5S4_9ACTN|nr:DEAD/DEAH box helicase [Micromonospora carbonacea]SCE79045.1 Helicase conserved C-terminal domain-containing protein [Micromonospora carbonacea]
MTPMPTLRGYQREAVDAVVAALADGGRGQVRAACGSGKSIVAVHAGVRLCPSGLVVVAVPSLTLLAQTLNVWVRAGAAARVLAVCGDGGVADEAVRVVDLTCPVTTDAAQIAGWATQHDAASGLSLVLVTHRSADTVGRGLNAAGVAADLLIVDEAHHTAGWAGKHGALVHRDEHLPARRRLYMSATPRLLPARLRTNGDGDDVLSMDETAVFGPVCYTYSFAQAISDGWLDDYRVLAIGVTSAQALEMLRDLDPAAVVDARAAPLRTVVVQTALVRAAAEFGLRRVVVFTPRVQASREFARTLPAAVESLPAGERPKGRLTVGHVDGTQSITQRRLHLRRLAEPPEDGWTVLSNARCLGEGVDVPAVDAIVLTAPKESPVDVVQVVGRAVRRNPAGSGIATILLPVLLPDDPADMTSDVAGTMTRWATLLQTLRALRAHDSALAADLDLQRARTGTGAAELPPRLLVRLPDGYASEQLLRRLTVRVLEETTPDWMVGYGALRDFHADHGHTRVPTGHLRQGVRLDRWVFRQRADHKAGRLAQDRVDYLNALGFHWEPREGIWARGLTYARRFHAEHGHLHVPHGHVLDGFDLYNWLWQQRAARRAGTLPADRVADLDALGIDWSIRASHHDGYAAARRFHAEHGHLDVPFGHTVNGIDLYRWLSARRVDYQKGALSAERVRALEALGIHWSIREAAWQRNLAAATAYYQREGHLHPRKGHDGPGVDLAKWLSKQRAARRAGALTDPQIAALDAIGMQWEIPSVRARTRQVTARRRASTPDPAPASPTPAHQNTPPPEQP